MPRLLTPILLSVMILMVTGSSVAQPLTLDRSIRNSVVVEFLRPQFDSDVDFGIQHGRWGFNVRVATGEKLYLVGRLPLWVNAPKEHTSQIATEDQIGNVYLGLEIGSDGPSYGQVGVRLPTASDAKNLMPVMADPFQLDAFSNETFSLRGSGHWGLPQRLHNVFFDLGTSIVRTSRERTEIDLIANYGFGTEVDLGQSALMVSLQGMVILSEPGNIGSQTTHWFWFSGSFGDDPIRLLTQLRVPLDRQFGRTVNYVFGLGVQISVG